MTTYHESMCALATQNYENHELVAHPIHSTELAIRQRPWMITNPKAAWPHKTEIVPVGFGRLLVQGACDPLVFGNYSQDNYKYHPIVELIGKREPKYLDYVAGKTIPPLPPYYAAEKAEVDLAALRARIQEGELYCEESELHLAELGDRIRSTDWAAVHTYLYENFDIETEDVGRFGRVLAPPNFYHAVYAVKRLWELLEHRDA